MEARRLAQEQHKTLEWWYRSHYRLPANDSRFTSITREQMLLDYYMCRLDEGHDISMEAENPDYEADLEEMERELAAASGEWETVIDE